MNKLTRRKLLTSALKYSAGACALSMLYKTYKNRDIDFDITNLTFPEAMFYKKTKNNMVRCELCPRKCEIAKDNYGYCLARKNINGVLRAVTYGHIFYYHHKRLIADDMCDFSIGAAGCNFKCPFCITHLTSISSPDEFYSLKNDNYKYILTSASSTVKSLYISPKDMVKMAKEKDYKVIKHSGNEPFTYYEYLYELCNLSKKNNIHNMVLSNAYIEKEPLNKIINSIDSFMFSIKSFSHKNHKKWLEADLDIVLENIKRAAKTDIPIDIAYVLIPGKTDNLEEITALCKWFKNNLPKQSSLIYLKYNSAHLWENIPGTDMKIAQKALDIASGLGISTCIR